jgi:hypothetical protein
MRISIVQQNSHHLQRQMTIQVKGEKARLVLHSYSTGTPAVLQPYSWSTGSLAFSPLEKPVLLRKSPNRPGGFYLFFSVHSQHSQSILK